MCLELRLGLLLVMCLTMHLELVLGALLLSVFVEEDGVGFEDVFFQVADADGFFHDGDFEGVEHDAHHDFTGDVVAEDAFAFLGVEGFALHGDAVFFHDFGGCFGAGFAVFHVLVDLVGRDVEDVDFYGFGFV